MKKTDLNHRFQSIEEYDYPAYMIWVILEELLEFGFTPESIGSSYEEFESILVKYGC